MTRARPVDACGQSHGCEACPGGVSRLFLISLMGEREQACHPLAERIRRSGELGLPTSAGAESSPEATGILPHCRRGP